MKDFGERLKKFALAKYGSVQGLADALGVSQTTISRYISGKVMPGGEFFSKIGGLGCDLNWLIIGTHNDANDELMRLHEEKLKLISSLKKLIDN